MSVRAKFDREPEDVIPKAEESRVETFADAFSEESVRASVSGSRPGTEIEDDKWTTWSMGFNFEGLEAGVSSLESVVKNLTIVQEQISQLLKAMRFFSGGVMSLTGALNYAVKQVSEEINEFISSLVSTGLYMNVIAPGFDRKDKSYSIPVNGGYREFISRVNSSCLSSTDPDAPRFRDPSDRVGGVIIATLGGTDDPDYLHDMVHNFSKLGDLFGFMSPFPTPSKYLKAVPGFYKKDSVKRVGIKLTWEAPDIPVKFFYVYRTEDVHGVSKPYIRNGKQIPNTVFASEPLVKIPARLGKTVYKYIDFDAPEKVPVYYKVYSVPGDDYFEENPEMESITSPIASPHVSAMMPEECIPLSELEAHMNMSVTGELLSPVDLEGEWKSVSARKMFGNIVESMFTTLDALTKQLQGYISTGGAAVKDYTEFYENRIQKLLQIIQNFRNAMIGLSSFTLRGTFMVMRLPAEEGGMQGFVDRFNRACSQGRAKATGEGMFSAGVEKNSPIALYSEEGIMYGVVLLYGVSGRGSVESGDILSQSKMQAVERDATRSVESVATLLRMLGLE